MKNQQSTHPAPDVGGSSRRHPFELPDQPEINDVLRPNAVPELSAESIVPAYLSHYMRVIKLLSGGQTGAERGALAAAIAAGVPHGGFCLKDRNSEDGPIPSTFHLMETTALDPRLCSTLNVATCNVTFVFTYAKPHDESFEAIEYAHSIGKPMLRLDLENMPIHIAVDTINRFLYLGYPRTNTRIPEAGFLNVTGDRESSAPGIQARVQAIISQMLTMRVRTPVA